MKTELVMVTPRQAREWLERNINNRPLRPGAVDALMSAYKRGEWRLTHQGIAFSKDGRLLDGQHRLSFISELPEGSQIPMNVSVDVQDEAFDAIDQGKVRSLGDLYGISQGLSAVGRFFALFDATTRQTRSVTPALIKPYIDWVQPEYEMLISFSPSAKKFWSCAGIRSAAIFQMKQGHDADRIRLIYDALIKSNISAMPHAARIFAQQYLSGVAANARSTDVFFRALKVFNTKTPYTGKNIVIRDASAIADEVRAFMAASMKKSPGKAGQVVAKPGTQFSWKKAA